MTITADPQQKHILTIATQLKDATKPLYNALHVAQKYNQAGYLTADIEVGLRAASTSDSIQVQLYQLNSMPDISAAEVKNGLELVKDARHKFSYMYLDFINILEARIRDEPEFIAAVIENSSLMEIDRAQQNWHASINLSRVRQLRVNALQAIIEDAEYELRHAESTYQIVIQTNQDPEQLAELQQTIGDLRPKFDGDPAAAARVQELLAERESLLMQLGYRDMLNILTILLPKSLQFELLLKQSYGGTLNILNNVLPSALRFNQNKHKATRLKFEEINQELATLMEQVGIRTRLDWAVADLDRADESLKQAQARLIDAVSAHSNAISAQSSLQRTYLTEVKAKIAKWYPPGSLAYNMLRDLEAVLDTADSALFSSRYTAFTYLMTQDSNLRTIVGKEFYQNKVFKDDPRLAVEQASRRFAKSIGELPIEIMTQEGFVRTMLLGNTSLYRNVVMFQQKNLSSSVYKQHELGLYMDTLHMTITKLLDVLNPTIEQLRQAYVSR